MNGSESELDTTPYLKNLTDAIDQNDTTSSAAWEALTVLSTFWMKNGADDSTINTATSSSKHLYQIRSFFLNLFPLEQFKKSNKGQDGEIWDPSTANSQSSHLLQLFKVIVQSIYISKEDMSQNRFHIFRSIIVPLVKAFIRRDAVFQIQVPSGNDLITDEILEYILDTSSEQSHGLVVLMEIIIHLPTIKHWNRIKHAMKQMISDALESNHDKDIVIAMTTSISKVMTFYDGSSCNTNGSCSRDDWMWTVLKLYDASSQHVELFESVDKMMWQAISSSSQSAVKDFVMVLNTIKSHQLEENSIAQWVLINISLMCYKIIPITTKSGHSFTLLEELIVNPIIEKNDVKFDIDINMKEIINALVRDDCTFSFRPGEIEQKDVLIFINKISNLVKSCIYPIKNNQRYIWGHTHLFVDLIGTTLVSSVAIETIQIPLAILSISVTIFMDCIDWRKNIFSIFLDALQRYKSSKEDTLQEFVGPMLVMFTRLLSAVKKDDHALTSTLMQIVNRSMTSSSHRTLLRFVLKALSFSDNGRRWILDHVVPELVSCSMARRSHGVLGLEALIGLCSYSQFLDDVHVIRGLRYTCELLQNREDDTKLDFITSQLDPWAKERLLNAALLSFIQYFCENSDLNYGCNNNFIFIHESERLNKLPTLVRSILKLLPTNLRIYLVMDQDIPSEIPRFLSIAISCLRALLLFLTTRSEVSSSMHLSSPSSDLLNASISPVYESISKFENNMWATKMCKISTNSEVPLHNYPSKIDLATISFNRKWFSPATRLYLCTSFLENFFMWRTNISCIDISHKVHLLLGATGSYMDYDKANSSLLKNTLGPKRICMIWKLVIGSLKDFEEDKVSSCVNRKEYIYNLFSAIQLTCSEQTVAFQCENYSSIEALALFQDIRCVYKLIFVNTASYKTYFVDDDKFIREFKRIILDQLLIILTHLEKNISRLHPKFDTLFYSAFMRDIGQDLKNSCEGRCGGVTKSLLRSYIALIEKLLDHIEKMVQHVELNVSSWNIIVNLNIVSLLFVDILFLFPMPKSILKSLSQISMYQIPSLVRNTKLELLKKRIPCLMKQKSGVLDPILVVSTFKKCTESNELNNNYEWLSIFCAETIGRLLSESNNIKHNLNTHSIQNLMDFPDSILLDYYREQHSWIQTLLHSICNYHVNDSVAKSTLLRNTLAISSARIFGSLKKNVNNLTRSYGHRYENGPRKENSLSILESYLSVSTWILFANQVREATPIKMLQGVQGLEQKKKNETLVSNFHAHLRKLLVSLDEYDSYPLTDIMSFVHVEIYGSNQLNFSRELMLYLERNGVKPVKANRRSLSTRKRSRTVKRSRNQLIDEWLEVDHETQDDFEDLEDFLLPG